MPNMGLTGAISGSQEARAAEASEVELSVVMPCLNESRTLGACIQKAQKAIKELGIRGEIIVADNGSTDGSQAIADGLGARVVPVEARGYGNALRGGIAAARGRYVIMGDSDGQHGYDAPEIEAFLVKLREGNDLVMGNRFQGRIHAGAMPPLHRFLGNPVLSGVGRLFFRSPCRDFHCGLRGFRKESIEHLNLRTTGMEFASEMVVKATLFGLRIAEIPTTLFPDGRDAPPHLRTWQDGWRHLRFLLLYSPRWLFLYPGFALILFGLALGAWLLPGPHTVDGVTFGNGTLLFAAMAILVGVQSVSFAVYSKIFAISEGLLPEDPRLTRLFRYLNLEVGLVVGAILVAVGAAAWGFSLSS